MGAYENLVSLSSRGKYIFNIIQKNGPITKNEIIHKTGIKLSTLNRDIQTLINNNIIIETAIAESTGGRKPVLYDINPKGFYSVGIDISRTYTQIIVTDLKLRIIGEKTIKGLYNAAKLAEIIPGCIKTICTKFQIDKNMIIGIGIGIVGGYDVRELQDKLSDEYVIPVHADNGANTAVTGEYLFGLGKNKQNIVYINCGVGIRTGVISSGNLIRTINHSEDAFAHMIVDIHGELCSCGNYGCIESYSSITRITQDFITEVKKDGNICVDKDLDQIDYMDVCRLAEDKNSNAVKIIMNAAAHFGIGLSNYIRLFNPQLIILSGPLVKHSQLFYEESKKIATEKSHVNSMIEFSRGGYFKNKSIAVGACVMAIEKLLDSK